jgi:diacylglycerol O-acyltransferase 1
MGIAILKIGVPSSYIWLCIFYWLFHAWTNFWGEVTRFADRRFYSDWWNSGNLAEYWRKWNYPIHNWLVRHVYFPLVRRGCSSEIARLLTFTVSAVFHEYIIVGTFRVFNMSAFTMMIINVPLMQLQKVFRGSISKNLNNIFFWLGFTIIGLPIAISMFAYTGLRHTLYEKGGPLYIE